MQKNLRVVLVILLMFLLAGCFGLSKKDVYDGSLTVLEITIDRKTTEVLALQTQSEEVATVYVRITKTNDEGELIYDVTRVLPLEQSETSNTLTETVPADKGYKLTAINAAGGVLEIGEATTSVPANKVTSVNITLEGLEHLLVVPEAVYSGGTTEQFKLRPSEFGNTLRYQAYLSFAPWDGNGRNYMPHLEWYTWSATSWTNANRFFPEVTEPVKLYYQYYVWYDVYFPGIGELGACFPDLTTGAELPYIWLYPSPDWEPVE